MDGYGEYLIPRRNIKIYVDWAVSELKLDPSLVNDMDSEMYAWRLSYKPENSEVARKVFGSNLSLSQLARAMADANEETRLKIEKDPDYLLPAPHSGEYDLNEISSQ